MKNITPLDDFPIHQTSETLSVPSTTDRNFYDRYWFNGFSKEKDFLFEIGVGVYPNRHIIDGHFSISFKGKQYSFHASKRLDSSRYPMVIGPISLEIPKPMEIIKFTLQDPEKRISCNLEFNNLTLPHIEPKSSLKEGTRILMDTSRFTQFGTWTGEIQLENETINLESEYGTRDKSWGVRPVGEPEGGAPGKLNDEPGVYWCWAPINFGQIFTHFGTFEDHDGNSTQLSGEIITVSDNGESIKNMTNINHSINWIKGTRWSDGGDIKFKVDEKDTEIKIKTVGPRFHCKGIGYQHPEWGHGFWKGEEAVGYEVWDLNEINPEDYSFFHIHQIIKATMNDFEGYGTLENLVVGRHDPSGFKDLFDVTE